MKLKDFRINFFGEAKKLKKSHWNWRTVFPGKRFGGLALGGTLNRNRTLLGKWLWGYP